MDKGEMNDLFTYRCLPEFRIARDRGGSGPGKHSLNFALRGAGEAPGLKVERHQNEHKDFDLNFACEGQALVPLCCTL